MKGSTKTRVLMLACAVTGLEGTTACAKKKTPPPIAGRSALADSADQIMFGVRLRLTDGGVDRAYIIGDTAFFFNDNTRVELERVHAEFHKTTGEPDANLTARHGTYVVPTGMMAARGDAVITSMDGRRLQSEEIKYDKIHNEVSSDSAFVLTEPDRRLEGVGFRSDPNLRNVRVLRVLSGTSGPVDLSKPTAQPGAQPTGAPSAAAQPSAAHPIGAQPK